MGGDTGKTKYRRRIYVIDREFQYRYMTTWILMTLSFVAVNALVLYWGARTEEQGISSEIVLGHLSFMMRAGAIFVICVTIFLGCLLLLLSHRIAGPAYRIRKCMSRITKGDYSFDVRLRRRDYLKGVADAMNDMIAKLRERRVRLESMRTLWRQVAPAVQSSPDGGRVVADINKAFDDLLLVEPPGEETKSLFVPRGLSGGTETSESGGGDTTQG